MEPSSTQCFIVYFGHYFRVRLNPETKKAVGISIASENEHEPVKGQRAEEIDMAGIKLLVFRGPDGTVSGAALSRRSPSPPPPPSTSNLQWPILKSHLFNFSALKEFQFEIVISIASI